MRASSRLAAGLSALRPRRWPSPHRPSATSPDGPAVNQIDLHPPMSPIAIDQQWLHNFMLVVCMVIFVAVFGVMFYSIFKHRKSQGCAGRQLPREHDGRDRLDGRAVHHRHPDGVAGDARRRRDEGHHRGRPDDQGHRHPVEVGLRLPQRRGRRHRLPVDARRRAARDVRRRQAAGRRLPAQGRQPAGRSGRQEGAHHHDRERRDPRLGRAVARRQAGRDSRLRARHLVPRRARPATTTASAPSSAARSTRTCRSTSRCCRRPTTPPGSSGKMQGSGGQGRRSEQGLGAADAGRARRAGLHRQLRGLPPGRPARAAATIKALDGSPIGARRRQGEADPHRAERRRTTARCRRGSSSPTPRSPRSSPTRRTTGRTRPARSCSRPKSPPHASSRQSRGHRFHERSHRTPGIPAAAATTTRWRTTITSITARRTAGGAGSTRPTTRTSARCTCCSRSRCSWSAALLALRHPRRAVPARACSSSTRSSSTS